MSEDIAVAGIGAVLMIVYCILGFGVSRMLSKIYDREVRMRDFVLWWFALCIFATTGELD